MNQSISLWQQPLFLVFSRHCGRILCSKCSGQDVPIIKFNLNKPVRVCDVCFDVLQGADNFTKENFRN